MDTYCIALLHSCKDIKPIIIDVTSKDSCLFSDSKCFYSCVLDDGKHFVREVEYIEVKSYIIYIYSFK